MKKEESLSFVLNEAGNVSYQNHPIPSIRPHDVLVHVCYTGICGSDVHYYKHGKIGRYTVTEPMVLGHESSGVVVSIGSSVVDLSIGDRVAMEPGIPCRRCPRCRDGRYNLCPQIRFAATPPIDGTLTQFYALPADFCHRLPDHVSLMEGAIAEPLAVAVHIVRQAGITPGQSVVVFGAGTVGLLCCAVARVFGASTVTCVDISKDRLEFAAKYAATHVYLSKKDTPEQAARDILAVAAKSSINGGGYDAAIEATGAPSCIATCVHVTRTGGVYVQAGMSAAEVTFPVGAFCEKEIVAKGSFRYREGDYSLAIAMLERGEVDLQRLITRVVDFEEAEDAFTHVAAGQGIKTVIQGVNVLSTWR